MTRTRKLVLSAGAGLAGLSLLLLTGGVAVVRSDWFKEQVRQRIVREVQAATGGRVEIGEFRFDWSQLSVAVRSFVLHGTEAPPEPPLFQADSVQVGLKIISILQRDVDIESLTVVKPRVRVIVYPDGRTNLPKPEAARAGRSPLERVLALAIGRFRVEGGLVEIKERRFPLDLRGQNLSAKVFYDGSHQRYSGDLSFRQLHLVSPSLLPVVLDSDFSIDLEANRLVVRAARFAANQSSAQARGTIENLLAPRVSAAFESKLSLAELRPILKLPEPMQGMLDLNGRLTYSGLSDYALVARASGSGLRAQVDGSRVEGIRLSSGLEVRPDGIDVPGITLSALGGSFSGRAQLDKTSRFRVAGEVSDISTAELARLRDVRPGPWNGLVSGPVEIDGRILSGRPREVKASGKLTVAAVDMRRPFEGLIDLSYDQRTALLEFRDSRLATPASRLQFSGALHQRLQVAVESSDLNDILPVAAYLSPDTAPSTLPVALKNGIARFSGTVTGGLENPRLSGHALLTNFSSQGQAFDRLEADVVVSSTALEASQVTIDQGATRLEGRGRATLRGWKPDETGPVTGSFSLRGLTVDKLQAESGSKLPVRGILSGAFQVAGTPRAPEVTARVTLSQAAAYGRRLDQAQAQLRYAGRSLGIESFQLSAGTTRLSGSGVFTHREGDWKSGSLKLELTGRGFRLAEAGPGAGLPEGLDGTASLQLRGEASVEKTKVIPADLRGTISFRNLAVDKKPIGDLQLTADTQKGSLLLDGIGLFAGATITGQASCRLQGDNPVQGKLSFTRISLDALRPWLPPAAGASVPVGAFAEGTLSFTGAGLNPGNWTGRLEMPVVEILPPPGSKPQVPSLRNTGPVVLLVSRKEVRIQSARFAGTATNLEASGRIDLGTQYNAFDLRLRGNVNLAILQNFDQSLTATGESALDATIRGPRSKPEIYGRMDLKKASLFLSGVPNGIDNANGVVFLFRDRATIESVTAETGGGKVTLNGFVGFGNGGLSYRLQATASRVRVRYPEGVSTTLDAAVDLTGTSSRSLLSGKVTILRAALSPNTDFSGILTRSSQPMITPATQNEMLRGMQLEVRVETAPDARFDTTLTRDIQAEASLRLRGTPYKPVLLGRVVINQGELNFMGNRYTISRGEITSLNPVRLEPIVNLDLETRVRGIDVTLNFAGPPDRLNVTYRSDPPLQINEIIALLAVGRAPTSDPTLLARQTERDQSWQQIGASTLIGQALAGPLASRLQKFFGVSRIKIDPKLTGLGNNPEAQLTLEQQVSKDITFTYVTSLAQEQQQLIRVEWNVSRQWSVLAVREENGLFGVEVQFKKQFK